MARSLHVNHGTEGAAFVQQVERLIDFAQLEVVRDVLVQLQAASQVPVYQLGHVTA